MEKQISVLMLASSNKKSIIKKNFEEEDHPKSGVKYDIQKFQEKYKDFNPNYIESNEEYLLSRLFIINWLKV